MKILWLSCSSDFVRAVPIKPVPPAISTFIFLLNNKFIPLQISYFTNYFKWHIIGPVAEAK
jgi:hypothetical protein